VPPVPSIQGFSEHDLLALIVERKTGLPFAVAVEKLVLRPLSLAASGADDDSKSNVMRMAKGYQPEGTYELIPASTIHWSAKAGNASVYTTAADEARLVSNIFSGRFLSAASRGPYSIPRRESAMAGSGTRTSVSMKLCIT